MIARREIRLSVALAEHNETANSQRHFLRKSDKRKMTAKSKGRMCCRIEVKP